MNKIIAGIDEVGRGCLFGDVVACCIVMPEEKIEGVNDSKKLTEKKRELLYNQILKTATAIGIGRVPAEIIDEINIKNATRLAMKKSVMNLRTQGGNKLLPDLLLIDAEKVDLNIDQRSIIKGDETEYLISCASIVAKVFRDRLCLRWSVDYPDYGLEKHKGYGTKYHRDALKKIGVSALHRKSFLNNMRLWK